MRIEAVPFVRGEGSEERVDFSGRPLSQVQPGQVMVSTTPRSLVTIVGSCVAVCLYDAVTRSGGVNHFLLPGRHSDLESTRYGPGAMRRLIVEMRGLRAGTDALVAKVFGGASLLASGRRLGRENVDVAFRLLEEAGIPVVAEDVYGTRGRKLLFHTDTGDTWVRRI